MTGKRVEIKVRCAPKVAKRFRQAAERETKAKGTKVSVNAFLITAALERIERKAIEAKDGIQGLEQVSL